MSAEPGRNLLHYRLLDKIGEGGMGEVWRATDTSLDREVAIKVLPAAFTSDPDRLARFEREAKVLASLNHPHIAAIHGLHEDGGTRFLSMELVPGEDLSARIARGPVAIEDALSIGGKIAEALEYAHDRGIVHRDLKPANVKITPEGDVKVLDFGLAKAMAGDPSMAGLTSAPTMMPTLTSAGTAAGLILGTAAYMSPEQARGRPVDKRADIWAFGCVLYEMLVGHRLFDGETVTDVLAAVVTRDPDWSALPGATPSTVRRILARCLDRDSRARLRDIGEARIVLASPGAVETAAAPAVSSLRPSKGRWWFVAATVALFGGIALGRYVLAPRPPATKTFEFEVTVSGQRIETGSFALSPDGRRLVLAIRDASGERRLCVRDMDSVEARVLPGTAGGQFPFWSPDGTEIAFFAGNQLFRIALEGAAARPIGVVPSPMGGSWGRDDVILVGSASGPIVKVSAAGGKPPEPVTALEKGVEDTHAWPVFLPDGRRFLFMSDASTDEGHRIQLGSLEGDPPRILKKGIRSQPVLDPAGRVLLGEQGQLVAYPFDLERGVLGDASTLLAAQVYPLGSQHHAPFSASAGGMLAYQKGSPESELVQVDMAGRVTKRLGGPERYGNVAISPDGKRVSFEIASDTPEKLVWVEDLERGVRTAISQRGHLADSSAWSADGKIVYFDSNVTGKWEVYRKTITGGGEPENLGTPAGTDVAVLDVSGDGRWLLAAVLLGDQKYDLYLRALDSKGGEWLPWATGVYDEDRGSFSPDSNWIVYTSDASGRTEVYLAPREGGPSVRRWQISAGGGYEPRFSVDGKTIYYRSSTFDWMAVPVSLAGGEVEAGTPKALFAMHPVELPFLRNLMDVMPDGSGFLTIQPIGSRDTTIRVRTGR